jgi:O-antigen ligase
VSGTRPKLAALVRWYAAVLLFLAPLKFGGVIGLAEDAFFPMDGWQWAFFVWPPFLVSFLAGVAFLLAVAAHPRPVSGPGRWPVLAWGILPFAAMLGLLRTTEWDYALAFVCHLASAAVLALGVRRLLAHDAKARGLLMGAVCLAVLWCCISGIRQRFGGLAEMQVAIEKQAVQDGKELPSELHDKLRQTRVYGPFQIANLYAAHLVLVAPLLLVGLWRLGSRFEPKKVSQPLLAGLGALLFLGALYWSGSRGAVLGLVGGVGLAALSLPALRRWRVPIVVTALVLGIGLVFIVGGGRNLLSASARLGYYRSALLMFRDHPVVGAGLGEFHAWHLRLRPLGSEPTRMPHNMLLGFLGQAGLVGGLAALACLLVPAWLAFAPAREDGEAQEWHWERLAVIAGLGAWSAHAILDLNVQVPGTLITAVCLPLLIMREHVTDAASPAPVWRQRLVSVGQLVLVTVSLAGIWRVPGEWAFQRFATSIDEQRALPVVWEQGKTAAKLLGTSPHPDRILGRIAEGTRNPTGAVQAYAEAVSRAPHRAALWARLGRARMGSGDLTGAAAATAMAVEWNPGFAPYQAQAALIRAMRSSPVVSDRERRLLKEALTADYALADDSKGTNDMVIRVDWPQDVPPPSIPLAELIAWLAPHAGEFVPGAGPIRFQLADKWTAGP